MTATPTLRPGHLPRVPTLTEVIDVPDGLAPAPAASAEPLPPPVSAAPSPVTSGPVTAPPVGDEASPWPAPVTPPGPAPTAAPASLTGHIAAAPVGLPTATPAAAALTALEEQQMTQKVLAEVQQRIDLMFEYRLREALAPALSRLTDAVLRDARVELATTLRDVVARAVAQELSRHRQR